MIESNFWLLINSAADGSHLLPALMESIGEGIVLMSLAVFNDLGIKIFILPLLMTMPFSPSVLDITDLMFFDGPLSKLKIVS